MVRNWGCGRGRVGSVDYGAKADQWEWRVCDRYGTIMGGFESTRPLAKYRSNWALFLLLSSGYLGDRAGRGRRLNSPDVRQFQTGAPFRHMTENESPGAL
jgi:hypothetical protein